MNEIRITEVCVYPIKPTEKGLVGFASCLFDDKLFLHSIAIYTRPDGSGYRLLFPTKMLPNGKKISIFYPVNKNVGEAIEQAITKKLEDMVEKVMCYERGEKV